jgi:hypothetical protein
MFVRFSLLAVVALLASGCSNTSPVLGGKNISYGVLGRNSAALR